MKFRIPAWDVDSYASDRRAHSHRCKCCNRVLAAGDRAFMAKVGGRKTICVHAECADKQVMPERSATWRDMLREIAFQFQLACFGYSETNPKHYAKVEQLRAECGAPRY